MTEFVLVLGASFAFLATLFSLWASQRRDERVQQTSRRQLNAQAMREEFQLLEVRHGNGELDADEWARAQAQLQASLNNELQEQSGLSNPPFGLAQKILIVLLPVAISAAAFYASNGSQHFFAPAQQAEGAPASLEEMVARLRDRLDTEPDDVRGWAMLGRSYSVMEQYSQAVEAYARANELLDNQNAELLIAQAEALGMANGQDLSGEPYELLQAALQLEPQHPRALWYALIAATQVQDAQAKQDYLDRLSAVPDLPDELAKLLQSEFGVEPKPRAPDVAVTLPVSVSLAPGVLAAVSKNATVFVYAKAQSGPPMPLAVFRKPIAQLEWPLEVILDDSMSMLENMRLSNFKSWTVVARISESGQAIPQSGDWMVSVAVDQQPTESLSLQISQKIP